MSQNTSQRLTVTRVTGHIGAGIDGTDLSHSGAPRTVADIREALLTHKVVFVHDQKIGHAEHVDAVNPPMASILRAETAPTYGGDTLVGDIPVGPGGFTSHAVVGRPLGSTDR
ncbi:TauD/TfdA dioxygenase family protein [Nocardia sp. NPDC058658]|uniref:TauD/TfdA dioxygenase family protein n=1 Tax=Nocardia sp. NPDC058658 TaxID=3346580 RepID=UPI00364D4627